MAGTWSYDPALVGTNEVDTLRLLVGDTDSQAWLLANEEYAWAISTQRNLWAAAAQSAENIAMLFTRRVDVKLGRAMQIAYSKTADQYFQRAAWLRKKSMGTVVPYIGGALLADKQALQNDPALVAAIWTKEMGWNPWVGGYSSDTPPPIGNAPTPLNEQDG